MSGKAVRCQIRSRKGREIRMDHEGDMDDFSRFKRTIGDVDCLFTLRTASVVLPCVEISLKRELGQLCIAYDLASLIACSLYQQSIRARNSADAEKVSE